MQVKRKKCNNGGFTLVELLVVILTGSVITLAATTILLLGLRVNHQSGEMLTRQNTTRILLSALEDVIAEGTVVDITTGPDAWVVSGKGDGEETISLFSYSSADRTICIGETAILNDVIASHIAWDDTGKLITISVETEDGSYTASTYCRTGTFVDVNDENDDLIEEIFKPSGSFSALDSTRLKFLQTLAGQYKMNGGGVNPGLILDEYGDSTGEYYVEWYNPEWEGPESIPWCTCYVSWALAQTGEIEAPSNRLKWFAHVDYFKDYIQKENGWKKPTAGNSVIVPQGGDLIFFDWDGDGKPQHIGVVLEVSGTYVYTIEGNSANRVAVRKYALDDEHIDGYGDFGCLF